MAHKEKRLLVVLVLDTSGSMQLRGRITRLNNAVRDFIEALKHDKGTANIIDIGVVAFGSIIQVHPVQSLVDFTPRELEAEGRTELGLAILTALDLVAEWRSHCEQQGTQYFRPLMFLITDGDPTDEWRPAAERVRSEEERRQLTFVGVGVEEANMDVLRHFSETTQPVHIEGTDFMQFFQWASTAVHVLTYPVGESASIPPFVTWSSDGTPHYGLASTETVQETQEESEHQKPLQKETSLTSFQLLVSENQRLTSHYLTTTVGPYLEAVSAIQHIINEMHGNEMREVIVRTITYASPINVSLEGAAEATELVRDLIVPWRREHAHQMAHLEQREKTALIESYEAEAAESQARAQRELTEANKVEAETSLARTRAEVERMNLENEKLRLEIQEAKIRLALNVLDRLTPQLSDEQRISYAIQLLEPLGVLTSSPLQLALVEPDQNQL